MKYYYIMGDCYDVDFISSEENLTQFDFTGVRGGHLNGPFSTFTEAKKSAETQISNALWNLKLSMRCLKNMKKKDVNYRNKD